MRQVFRGGPYQQRVAGPHAQVIWGPEGPQCESEKRGTAPTSEKISERGQQLVEQLGSMNNRLLSTYTKVRDRLVQLIDNYEAVFRR